MDNYSYKPFAGNKSIESAFLSESRNEALARLNIVVESNGLGLLTGEIGSGKSTLIRLLIENLPSEAFEPHYFCISKMRPKDFYWEGLYQLGEAQPYDTNKAKRLWNEVIQNKNKQGKRKIVILVDEANEMNHDMILELRFIMNHEKDSKSIFPVLLFAQPEMRKTLRLKKFEPITQRFCMQYHLTGMSKDETMAYIKAEMANAKMISPVFAETALSRLYSYTQGIPRMINFICSGALFDVSVSNDNVVEEKHIVRVIADIEKQRGLNI